MYKFSFLFALIAFLLPWRAFAQSPCPPDMVSIGDFCIDVYEAPNIKGASPLVMYDLVQSEAWCSAHGKRICFDDEWEAACKGPEGMSWMYGPEQLPGVCNDTRPYRKWVPKILWTWPPSASAPDVHSLEELRDRVLDLRRKRAADHVLDELYQAEPSGSRPDCHSDAGVFDMVGNVEEWVRKRKPVLKNFSGRLKGRFWSKGFKCEQNNDVHADRFRFYETGFRCCSDREVE